MTYGSNTKAKITLIILVLMFIVTISVMFLIEDRSSDNIEESNDGTNTPKPADTTQITKTFEPKTTFENLKDVENGETLEVHFLNVGEADSVLIKTGKYNMLIDAGESSAGKTILQYLNELGVKQLDYLVATHPDQDHIGGMDTVISNIDIKNFYMTDFYKESKHYDNLIKALNKKNIQVIEPEPGVKHYEFELGQAKCRIIAPLNNYVKDDSNNSSIVIRMTFGKKVFLFMGDVQKESESDILNIYEGLAADVVKVAHHGRSDSSAEEFIRETKPEYAVIPCLEENITNSVVKKFEKYGAKVYVLGRDGTLIIKTDGKELEAVNNI